MKGKEGSAPFSLDLAAWAAIFVAAALTTARGTIKKREEALREQVRTAQFLQDQFRQQVDELNYELDGPAGGVVDGVEPSEEELG